MIRNDIIRFRATHNINQEKLSEMMDGAIGSKYISAYERGRLKMSDEFIKRFTALVEQHGIDESLPHDMESFKKAVTERRPRRSKDEIRKEKELKASKRKRRTKAEMAELRRNAVKVGQSLEEQEQVQEKVSDESIVQNNEYRLNEMLAKEIEKKLAEKEQEKNLVEQERLKQLEYEKKRLEFLELGEKRAKLLAEEQEREMERRRLNDFIEEQLRLEKLEEARIKQENERLLEEQRIKALVEERLRAYDEAERVKNEERLRNLNQIANVVEEPQTEIINLPPKSMHYHNGSVDVIKFAEENTEALESLGFYRISVLKYITRFGKKDGFNMDDLDKAIFFINKMKEITSKGEM